MKLKRIKFLKSLEITYIMADTSFTNSILRNLNNILPKKNIILFYSQYDYYDNPYYLYKKMLKMKTCEEFKCIWIVDTEDGFERVVRDGGVAVFRKDKKNMLKYITRAKYFLTSYTGGAWWKAKNQIGIFLDHGVFPLKTVGSYLNAEITKNRWKYFDYAVVTSPFTRILYSSIYQMNPSNIVTAGAPRDDIIFEYTKEESIKLLEKHLDCSLEPFEYKIFYLPTFRLFDPNFVKKSFIQLIKNEIFMKFLQENEAVLILKPHRGEEKYFKDLIEKRDIENIKILSNDPLRRNNLTIYEFFKSIDILISDYSSVWVEYLLLNKPIVYYIPDIEKYRQKRGLIIEPYELWTPGDKVKDVPSLINALGDTINDPKKWEKERLWMRDIVFTYKDNKARERIIRYFWR
ncbi:CDP-Glycerol:Poly(glycerophosphate) glycerophosphotransferase family [Aciduliprofundum boonei T469]|nr:CDP-Glycerol:Poly(glycerophosphate) glycerophosphotransferase family [Aciduliprofundum boonei T469]